MPGFKMRVKGIAQLSAELRAIANVGMELGIEEIGLYGVVKATEYAPVAFGVLANSIQMETEKSGNAVTAIIFAGPPADVYAAPVDMGTRPHFPPPQALLPWVRLKFQPSDEKQALSIAFAVAKAISKRGTKPQPFFDRALADIKEHGGDIMDKNIAAAFQAAGFGGAE